MTAADDRFRWLANELPDMIAVHNQDGFLLFASSHSRDLLGYDPDELGGTHAYNHVHPADLDRVSASHASLVQGHSSTVVYRLRRKDGTYTWVETRSRARRGDDGEVEDLLSSTRAVSDRLAVVEADEASRTEWTKRIVDVVAAGAITPAYQPIFELPGRNVVAFEALSRFDDDSPFPAGIWFAEATRLGLSPMLELAAVRCALEALPSIPPEASLCINVSPETLASSRVREVVPAAALTRIEFEVTEHARISDYAAFREAIAPLRRAGARLAVDDVGAGFASLRHILKLDPDTIKLDVELTRDLDQDPTKQALAEALVAFAHKIGRDVVAEGVETQDELDVLFALGVTRVQGYHLARPGPPPALAPAAV